MISVLPALFDRARAEVLKMCWLISWRLGGRRARRGGGRRARGGGGAREHEAEPSARQGRHPVAFLFQQLQRRAPGATGAGGRGRAYRGKLLELVVLRSCKSLLFLH